MLSRPPRSPFFPYTTLFRSHQFVESEPRDLRLLFRRNAQLGGRIVREATAQRAQHFVRSFARGRDQEHVPEDRKSTRLNSSHTVISYAVFCLKKKKRT